jgi:hypothetical protein
MSQPLHPNLASPPSPADLFVRYLRRQEEAHAAGLAGPARDGEVVPYEAGPVQPIDARTAWEEAVAVAKYLPAGREPQGWQAPPAWPTLVAGHESAAGLAFCLGNFPQLVRDLPMLLHASHLKELRPASDRPTAAPGLEKWAAQAAAHGQYPQVLLALGALRLARHFDAAAAIFQAHDAQVPAEWRPAWDNEKAALAWHRGQAEEAHALWLALPATVPVLFNRGMSALFLDRPEDARVALQEVVCQLPETSGWHHLAQLYLALAQMRS